MHNLDSHNSWYTIYFNTPGIKKFYVGMHDDGRKVDEGHTANGF